MIVRDGSSRSGAVAAVAGRPRRPRADACCTAMRGAPPAARRRGRSATAPLAPGSSLTAARLDALFDAQLASRHLDHAARWLRAQGARLLHDRLGRPRGQRARRGRPAPDRPGAAALPLRRLLPGPGPAGARATTASATCCSGCSRRPTSRSPAGATRCSATPTWPSSRRRRRSPRTCRGRSAWRSPSAGPAASACRRAGPSTRSPSCSFGDASLNHSTAQGALNAAAYTAHQGMPLPLLLVCEDNGLGHQRADAERAGSRRRWPAGRACATSGSRAPTRSACSTPPRSSPTHVRESGRPAVLHLRTVRYGGHAGTDVESAYRSAASIRADQLRDPLLATARVLVEAGRPTPAELVDRLPRRPGRRCASSRRSTWPSGRRCAPRPR